MNPSHPLSKKIEGVLAVDKPKGWTSHDVCAFIRKRFQIPKVGHGGTLDPLATGVLVLLLGRATKLSAEISSCDKEYLGTFELGVETDSHDRDGRVIQEASWEGITLERIREAVGKFVGEIEQTPPMISAIRYRGVRLYHLARRGTVVPREKRKITVHEFRMEGQEGAFVRFFAHVSKGTYLRTLVHDLGETLGCHATLSELRRTRAGSFSLEEAVTVEALKSFSMEALEQRVRPLSRVTLDSVKGRLSFASPPPARGMEPRAGTAPVPPAKAGAPSAVEARRPVSGRW